MKATSTQATDNQLVLAFQQGDNSALEILVQRHKDKLFTSILMMVKDKYLAEDMFQELFIKIIEKLRSATYNDQGKFLPWALRVAHNLCIDHFRKISRKPPVLLSDKQDIFQVLNLVEEGADMTMIKGQKNDKLRQVVDMLPAEQREVIVLRHYGDMSFKEIAEMTNTSINTALGRMRYGLMNLRKLIMEKQVAF